MHEGTYIIRLLRSGRLRLASETGEARIAGTLSAVGGHGTGGDVAVTGRTVTLTEAAVVDASGGTGVCFGDSE